MPEKTIFTPRYERFRRALEAARESAGFTQVQLADRLGKPQSYISKYERGERRLDVEEFLQVAEALEIDPAELIRDLAREPV